mmetsp:Transcript_30079/g.64461  ORF Transcript_30079/g.64461 Transcript_30079/m.64461 type:complete len:219 (+) Transcript_30079:483-1139(+)
MPSVWPPPKRWLLPPTTPMTTRSSTTTSTLLPEMVASKRVFPQNPPHSLPTKSSITSSSFTMPTKSLLTRWPNTPNPRTSSSVTKLTDGKPSTLTDTILMPSRKPSPLPRPTTTESLSSSSATPSSERVWKKPREPTLLTEKPVSHTLTEPRRTLDSLKVRSGSFPKELVTSSAMSKRRTRTLTTNGNPPTLPGRKPTPTSPSNWRTPLPTTPCLPKR